MAKSNDKIAYLDGIRGIAALCVFFHHFLLTFYSSYFSLDPKATHLPNGLELQFGESVFSVFTSGRFCVEIFFCAQWLCLSRKYFRENEPEILFSRLHSADI
jgi:peptidoglycan/LPS O-acetylase OafA/YrhL